MGTRRSRSGYANKTPLPEEFSKWEHFAVPFDAHLTIVEQKLGMTREGKPTGFFGQRRVGSAARSIHPS